MKTFLIYEAPDDAELWEWAAHIGRDLLFVLRFIMWVCFWLFIAPNLVIAVTGL